MKKLRKPIEIIKKSLIFLIFFLLFLSIILAVCIGSVDIEFEHAMYILMDSFGLNVPDTWNMIEHTIIMKLRLPRVLMAAVVGAMLGVAGVAAQGLFKNPIVDPYILGISSSANFGAAIVIVLELKILAGYSVPVLSFIISVITVGIVYKLSETRYGISLTALLLSGIAVSYIYSALTSFLLYTSEDKSHYVMSYLMGSFWGSSWEELSILFVIMMPSIVILYFYGFDLNVMVFSDEEAQSMGVNIKQTKSIVIILMTLLTSTAVSFCGSIGFVGLIIPHAMRLLVGSDNRKLIPLSAGAGALLLIWADVLARTLISPLEIPVGIFTSILGAPFFIYLVIKKKRKGELI